MVIFDKKEVGERIIQLQKILGLNNLKFAESVKADASYLSKVRHGHKPLSKRCLVAIEEKYKVNRQWLLFGKGEVFEKGYNLPYHVDEAVRQLLEERETVYNEDQASRQGKLIKLSVPLRKATKPTPVANDNVSAGTIVFTSDDEPELIVEYIDVPFIGWVQGMVEVVGASMEPTFKHGYRIAIKRLVHPALINWGEYYYIVDANWQGAVKKILEGSNSEYIILHSDNPDQKKYPPIKRKWSDIEAVFKVLGAIAKY